MIELWSHDKMSEHTGGMGIDKKHKNMIVFDVLNAEN
jgi:hypothetical protein